MKKAVVVISVLAMAGCTTMNTIEAETSPVQDRAVIETAKMLVAARTRDPEAPRFKEDFSAYKTNQGDYIVCGALNAKNAIGAYVGYKPFYVRIRENEIAAFAIPSEMDEYGIQLKEVMKGCADAAKGKIMVSS